jgi:hypothetical protein
LGPKEAKGRLLMPTEVKVGEWFIDQPNKLFYDEYTKKCEVIIRRRTHRGSVYIASFGTYPESKKNAKEAVKAHNEKLKKE